MLASLMAVLHSNLSDFGPQAIPLQTASRRFRERRRQELDGLRTIVKELKEQNEQLRSQL